MTVCSIGMLCNLLLFLVIAIDPLAVLHRGAWITILNLSVADFLACGSLFLKLLFYKTMPKLMEEASNFLWMFGVGASFIFLGLLTGQIYIIIKYPVKSRLILTRKRVLMSCTAVWLIAIAIGFGNIAYIWLNNMKVFYIYIANIAVLELDVVFQVVLKILIVIQILGNRHKLPDDRIQNKNEKHAAKIIIVLNVIMFLTAFPFFLAKQIEYLHALGHLHGDPLLGKFPYYYEPVALLNFVSNPLLYSFRLEEYRRSLLALFKFDCKKRHHNNIETQELTTLKEFNTGNELLKSARYHDRR